MQIFERNFFVFGIKNPDIVKKHPCDRVFVSISAIQVFLSSTSCVVIRVQSSL